MAGEEEEGLSTCLPCKYLRFVESRADMRWHVDEATGEVDSICVGDECAVLSERAELVTLLSASVEDEATLLGLLDAIAGDSPREIVLVRDEEGVTGKLEISMKPLQTPPPLAPERTSLLDWLRQRFA